MEGGAQRIGGGRGFMIDFGNALANRLTGGGGAVPIAPAPTLEDRFQNLMERATCQHGERERNFGKFYGTVLYLRNPDRGLWFGGGTVYFEVPEGGGGAGGLPDGPGSFRSPGFGANFQQTIRRIEAIITGEDAQPGGDEADRTDMANRNGNWPPVRGDNSYDLLPFVNYITEAGSPCIPSPPIVRGKPRNAENRFPLQKWQNETGIQNFPDTRLDPRYGQAALTRRAEQDVRCRNRTADQQENMVYPDPTCVGEPNTYMDGPNVPLTDADKPWCWRNNCIPDRWVQQMLNIPRGEPGRPFRGLLEPASNPALGFRTYIHTQTFRPERGQDWNTDRRPLPRYYPLWEDGDGDAEVLAFPDQPALRQVYLRQRGGQEGTAIERPDLGNDEYGYPIVHRTTWLPPRGVSTRPRRPGQPDQMVEGRDTFGSNTGTRKVLKDWAIIKIIRVKDFYDPLKRLPQGGGRGTDGDDTAAPGTAEHPLYNSVDEMKAAFQARGYQMNNRDGFTAQLVANDKIKKDKWVWVEVMDSEMCVDHYNDDNLSWGLWGEGNVADGTATGNVVRPSAMDELSTYKEDDRDCERRHKIEIMLKGGNWSPNPRMQDITKPRTIFCIPIYFIVGLSMTLGEAKQKGQEFFTRMAQGRSLYDQAGPRQLLEDTCDSYCDPNTLERVNKCNLSNPEMLSCLQNTLKFVCPCDDICSNDCRNFIQEYWDSSCRCEVTNWLNSNTEHENFDEIQQTATELNTLTSECGITPTECDSTTGCCVNFNPLNEHSTCDQQHSAAACKQAAKIGGTYYGGECMWFDPCDEKDDASIRCQHMQEGNCMRHQDDRCDAIHNAQGFVRCQTKVNKPRGPEITLPQFDTDIPDSTFRFITPDCSSMDADHIGETVNEKRNCTQSVDGNMNACFYDGDGIDSCESTQNSVSGNLVMRFQNENGEDVPCNSPDYNGVNACSDNDDPDPPSFGGARGIFKDKCEVSITKIQE